jgi:signal peptidase I
VSRTRKRAKDAPAAEKPKNVVAAARAKSGRRRPSSHVVWENVKGFGGAILIFLFVRTFLVEAYRIPSPSMVPALLVGDWLFVNKLVYGPHVPFTSVNLPGYGDPQRYEIVVFVSPPQVDQPWDPTPTLVKRLCGMPGDTIYMRDGKFFVNGVEQRQGYGATSVPLEPAIANEANELFLWQNQFALRASRFGAAPNPPTHDNWGPLVIPPRHYFMMGDNRYDSKDSRYWGFVPRENVRGRPMFVYYSWNADDSDRPLPFITDIRWRRIFHRIR